jgi:hypothetical protein
MPAAFSVRTNRLEARRADERRLSVAMGVSLLIHAFTLAVLRGVLPAIYALPQGGTGGFSVLQAVLAAPRIEPSLEPPRIEMLQPIIAPTLTRTMEPPVLLPAETGAQAASGPEKTGATLPEFSIGVGTIEDPSKLGPGYAARLAMRFPERISKPPVLIGTPVMSYPQAALESGVQRRVAALVTVRADGTIEEAQLAREDPLFGPAVIEALKSVRFAPAEIGGDAVPYWAIVEFVFVIGRPGTAPVAQRGVPRRGVVLPRQATPGR